MEKDDRLLCIYMGVMRSRQATGRMRPHLSQLDTC